MTTLKAASARRWRWILATCLAAASLGCASLGQDERDAVAVTALNYTGRDLTGFLFIDPETGKVAGGTSVKPYEGAGDMCCYSLPRRWRPGIKVKLRYDWWNGSLSNRQFEYVERELPPYPTDEPGMLWALFYEDGSVEVLASAVDPGHPQWPGRIKHWPIPSRERLLYLWQIEYDRMRGLIPYYQELIEGPSADRLKEIWSFRQRRSPEELRGFSGPDDPRFKEALQKEAAEQLRKRYEILESMEKNKP